MPKNPNIKKVLVIGSGPIVIGQAAEFDYAGLRRSRGRHGAPREGGKPQSIAVQKLLTYFK